MKNKVLALAFLGTFVATLASAQLGPSGVVFNVIVTNASGRCAWITPYWSRPLLAWTQGYRPQGADWVANGQNKTFWIMLPDIAGSQFLPYEFKVRAEFMSGNAKDACTHPVTRDTANETKSINRIKQGENFGMPRNIINLRVTLGCRGSNRSDCYVGQIKDSKY